MRVFVFLAAQSNHAPDLDQQLFVVPGLGKIVVGAELEGFHRGFHRAVSGDHEDGGFAVASADLGQHIHAGAVRHHQVEQHQIVEMRIHLLDAFGAILRQSYLEPFAREQQLEAFADIHLIVDNEDVAFAFRWAEWRVGHFQAALTGCRSAGAAVLESGNSMRNWAPPPGRLATSMEPPCSLMIPYVTARPSPVPWRAALVVKNGS